MEGKQIAAGRVILEVIAGGRHAEGGARPSDAAPDRRAFVAADPAPTGSDDAAWVQLALRGDRAAQEILFRNHFARVRRRVCRLLGPDAESDDIVQEAFLRAFQDLSKLKERRAFGGWVLAIAVHMVSRRLRRRRLLRRLGFVTATDRPEGMESAVSPALSPARAAEARGLYARLDRLPAEARVAFLLRRLEGLTVAEVAAEMDLSERTVKRRIAAAEQSVAAFLELAPEGDGR